MALFDASYAYNSSTGTVGNWLTRLIDPTGVEQAYNAYQANVDREFAHNEAELSRRFSERMSNTAYQRAVEDLRKAGFNPYAIYGGAQQASTPSSAYASASGARASGRKGLAEDVVETVIGSAFDLAGSLGKAAMFAYA